MVQKQLSYNQMGGKWILLLLHVMPIVNLKWTLDFSQKLKNYGLYQNTGKYICKLQSGKNLLDNISHTILKNGLNVLHQH